MTTVFCGVIQCSPVDYCCFRGTFFLYLHNNDNDDDDDEEEEEEGWMDRRTYVCMYEG
jgi:hypothetical protein